MASYQKKYLSTPTFGTKDGSNEACYMCFVCPDYCTKFSLPPSPQISPPQKYQLSPILIIMLCILGAFFLLFGYIVARCRQSSSTNSTGRNSGIDDFIHGNQGSLVSDPSWFIQTMGLPRSTIDSIGEVRYKRGEVSRECCVCLSEFQEEDRLRVLTKCSHAFHVGCIDTWLMSHMNCPVCRAPVLMFIDDTCSCDDHIISSSSAGLRISRQESELLQVQNMDINHVNNNINEEINDVLASSEEDEKREFVKVGIPISPRFGENTTRSGSVGLLLGSSIQLVPMKRSSSFS